MAIKDRPAYYKDSQKRGTKHTPQKQAQPLTRPLLMNQPNTSIIDSSFQTAQRQAMVTRLGGLGGNRYLQRLMAQQQQPAVKPMNSGPAGVVQRHCGDWRRHLETKEVPANCHEFVLLRNGATQRQIAEFRAASPSTDEGASLYSDWYGANIIGGAGQQVNQDSVKNLPEGTILIVGDQQRPMHSMIIAEQRGNETLIRGFNNVGTLGVGDRDVDDPQLRSLHVVPQELRELGLNSYWSEEGGLGIFGKSPVFAIDAATYQQNIAAVTNHPAQQNQCCVIL